MQFSVKWVQIPVIWMFLVNCWMNVNCNTMYLLCEDHWTGDSLFSVSICLVSCNDRSYESGLKTKLFDENLCYACKWVTFLWINIWGLQRLHSKFGVIVSACFTVSAVAAYVHLVKGEKQLVCIDAMCQICLMKASEDVFLLKMLTLLCLLENLHVCTAHDSVFP